jgi:psiF repeat-containing protein
MKATVIVLVLCALAGGTLAQTATPGAKPSCKAQATDKKLSGAALTSFMKKCEADATTACDTAAADKKLAGAAKVSFTKKCVTDAVGN